MTTDIDALKDWGAAAVVSLMLMSELADCKAGGIGAACEARGIEWYHLPIVDVSVPDDAFETAWVYAGLRLRAHLRAGRNVLVHCRGGLGRSGTIVGRLLVELGWTPVEAVSMVRVQRRGAIETTQQECHVLQIRTISAETDQHTDRVLGCILGGAVGDGFGYAVEFDRLNAIHRKHGPHGLRQPVFQGGKLVVSDDTQMALFTLEALNVMLSGTSASSRLADESSLGVFAAAAQRAYLRWGATQGVTSPNSLKDDDAAQLYRRSALRHRRAPGNTCLSAVRSGAQGTTLVPVNDSKGCGAVMRTAPIGLIERMDPATAMAWGDAAGALTHGHIDGWLPGGALSAIIRLIMQGEDIAAAAHQALTLLTQHPHPDSKSVQQSGTVRLLLIALLLLEGDCAAPEVFARLGEGWVGDEALAIGVYAAGAAASFEDAVRFAANHDGDSDSTASIAGQLYGVRHGVLCIPHAWVRRVDVLAEALEVSQVVLTL